jgi:hypothetical protein
VAARLPSFVPLTRAHVAAAFARSVPEDDHARTLELARAVRRELRGSVPFWRRAVGVLTPWSWMRAR